MNIIYYLPMILCDIRQYDQYKSLLDEITKQYECDQEKFRNGHIDSDDMELINKEYQSKTTLCKANISRAQYYLDRMSDEDREYIMNNNGSITERACSIFLSIGL